MVPVSPSDPKDAGHSNPSSVEKNASGATPSVERTPGDSFFSLLGLPEKFRVDAGELSRRYYERARDLHPDRFRGPAAMDAADRMSELNEAFETLKDAEERRAYLIRRNVPAEKLSGKGSLPMELAERWFEVQDLALEGKSAPPGSPEAVAGNEAARGFREELAVATSYVESKIASLESQFDALENASSGESLLLDLHREGLILNVLRSLKRDVDKLLGNPESTSESGNAK